MVPTTAGSLCELSPQVFGAALPPPWGAPRQGLLSQGALSPAFQPSRARVPAQEQVGGEGERTERGSGWPGGTEALSFRSHMGGVMAPPVDSPRHLRAATCSHQPCSRAHAGERGRAQEQSPPAPGRLQSTLLGPDGLKEKHWKWHPW